MTIFDQAIEAMDIKESRSFDGGERLKFLPWDFITLIENVVFYKLMLYFSSVAVS